MKSSDQAESRDSWRVQLSEMRTWGALRSGAPGPEAAERLSDRALVAAAQNPDHSEAGRQAALNAARARNVVVTPWRLRAPCFLTAADLARGERLFFGWGRRARVWSGFAAGAALVVLIAALVVRQAAVSEMAEGPVTAVAAFPRVFAADTTLYIVGTAFLWALVIWLLVTLLRAKPARIAVLAPAPSPLTRAPFARFLRRELRPFGHVLLHRPDGPIRTAAAYRAAAATMANKLVMNARAMGSSGATLRLGGSPAWAPFTQALATDSANAIVVDLSEHAHETLSKLNAEPARCVFVSLWGRLDAAEAGLRVRGVEAIVHHYAPDGEIQRRAAFRAGLLAAMRA